MARPLLVGGDAFADTISVDIMSLASFGEEDEWEVESHDSERSHSVTSVEKEEG